MLVRYVREQIVLGFACEVGEQSEGMREPLIRCRKQRDDYSISANKGRTSWNLVILLAFS